MTSVFGINLNTFGRHHCLVTDLPIPKSLTYARKLIIFTSGTSRIIGGKIRCVWSDVRV